MENYLWWVVATSVTVNMILFTLMWLSGRRRDERLEHTQEIAPVEHKRSFIDPCQIAELVKAQIERRIASDDYMVFPQFGAACRIIKDKATVVDDNTQEVVGIYNINVSVELTPA